MAGKGLWWRNIDRRPRVATQFWSESVAVSRAHCMPVRMYMARAAIYMHASIIAFAIGAPTFELARFVGCKSSCASLRFENMLESRRQVSNAPVGLTREAVAKKYHKLESRRVSDRGLGSLFSMRNLFLTVPNARRVQGLRGLKVTTVTGLPMTRSD